MAKDKKQTTTQSLDPSSQRYVDFLRSTTRSGAAEVGAIEGGLIEGPDNRSIEEIIAPFLNPYLEQVVGGIQNQYGRARQAAVRDTSQAATAAGAFNSSRHGATEGARLGQLDVSEAGQIGDFLARGFESAVSHGVPYAEQQRQLRERQRQEPLFRAEAMQGLIRQGLGPTGMKTTQIDHGSIGQTLTQLGGLGLAAYGAMNPAVGASQAFLNSGYGGRIQPPSSGYQSVPMWDYDFTSGQFRR